LSSAFFQILGGENGPLWKDYFEGGATWAFEVGSQSMTCPIIVEDLDQPPQMLVEVMTLMPIYCHNMKTLIW
jgi:hypothetical protein